MVEKAACSKAARDAGALSKGKAVPLLAGRASGKFRVVEVGAAGKPVPVLPRKGGPCCCC